MRFDDAVAFGVKGDGADRRPVARIAGPTRRIEFASLGVERMSGRQNAVVVAGMALVRADCVADTAVTMIDVVPMHETSCPSASVARLGFPLRWLCDRITAAVLHTSLCWDCLCGRLTHPPTGPRELAVERALGDAHHPAIMHDKCRHNRFLGAEARIRHASRRLTQQQGQ